MTRTRGAKDARKPAARDQPTISAILGSAQAEADSGMLDQAFIETADYQALRFTTDFNYVVGRRGTGKSAIFRRLCRDFGDDSDIILLSEQPEDYEMLELQGLFASLGTDYRFLRPVTRLLWATHFLVEGARAAATHYRFIKSLHAIYIQRYLDEHDFQRGTSAAAHCVKTLRSLLTVGATAPELASRLAAEFDVAELTDALRGALNETGLRIVAMYDKLDEGWTPDVKAMAVLGGLAKATADYREKGFPIYPIVFVRDNMFRALAQVDDDFTRHIEGHSLRLQWDEESLFHLIVARLRVALDLPGVESGVKVWDRFAHRDLHGRAGFEKCLRYTLYRPRDILVLLNDAYGNAARDNRSEIVELDIERSATRISQNRLEDLCKEYDRVLPGLRAFVGAFRGQPATQTIASVVGRLDSAAETTDYSDVSSRELSLFEHGGEMFAALYSVGFIGMKDEASGKFLFCHDGTMAALPSADGRTQCLVHPCYWKALDMAVLADDETVIGVTDEYDVHRSDEPMELRLRRLGRLPEDLGSIPTGRSGSSEFEAWVLRAVRVLFAGSLTNIEPKPNPGNALNQRDIVATNATNTPFWRRIYEDYASRQIVFESKNYEEVTPDDFRQVLDYSSGEYGRFVVIVRRGSNDALTESEKARIQALFLEQQRMVLVVPTALFVLCMRKLRTPKKYDYSEFTMSKHMDYVVRSVLSLKHMPRYKQKRVR